MTLNPEPDNIFPFEGILNINKPPGPTSFDIVAGVRRLLGGVKSGHAGTLDPMAGGVLLVVTGRATRLAAYLPGGLKRYRAQVTLGTSTDSDDAQGTVIERGEVPPLSDEEIKGVLCGFIGEIEQAPPAFSAVKVAGRRSYLRARKGDLKPPPARAVFVEDIVLIERKDELLTLEVICGAGTYIRSLARDLGRALGCGGHLSALVRLAEGDYTLDDAISPDALGEELEREADERSWFTPLDSALPWLEEVELEGNELKQLIDGQVVETNLDLEGGQVVRVKDRRGRLYALAELVQGSGLTPKVVLRRRVEE